MSDELIPNTMKEPIELFLVITGNYMKYAAVTILSVLENTSRHVNFKILCTDVSDEDKAMIGSMIGKFNTGVQFLIINDEIWDLLHGAKVNQFSYVGKPIGYVRFLIPHICDTQKAIYMDTDIVVLGDISSVWDTDFKQNGKQHAFAAAKGGPWKEGNLQLGLPEDYPHINSGVLLFNCAKWRKDKMFYRIMDIAKKTHYDVIAHDDQCAINIWGFQNGGQAEFGYEYNSIATGWVPADTKIMHYLGARPWIDPSCKFAYKWWEVARRTPYYERLLLEMLCK